MNSILVIAIILFLLYFGFRSPYKDRIEWKTYAKPNLNAKVTNISSEKVKYIKNDARFKTTVTFSDGFNYITFKTNLVDRKIFSYTIAVDSELGKEIIQEAIKRHDYEVRKKLAK